MNHIQHKIAFTTGGSSGIGLATATKFIDQGDRVITTGHNQATVDQAVAELGKQAFEAELMADGGMATL